MKRVLATLLAAALPCSALADDMYYNYIGVHGASLGQGEPYKNAGITDTVKTTDAFLKWGGVINKYVAAEFRLGGTISDEEITTVSQQTLTVSNDYFGGLYLRVQYPMSWLTLYGQVGAARVKASEDLTVGTTRQENVDKFTDTSFAGGAEMNLGSRMVLSGEYFQLSDNDGIKRAGPSVGLSWRF